MKRIFRSRLLLTALGLIMSAGVFRAFPGLSECWSSSVIRPFSLYLNRITGSVDFPVLEILCISVIICLPASFLRSLLSGISGKTCASILKWVKATAVFLLLVSAAYIFLWYPVYWTDAESNAYIPDTDRLVWLCKEIIGELNTASFEFSAEESILEAAAEVSGIPHAKVKNARYPGWMHALHIAGIYSPWTGEVIVSTKAPVSSLPFTAVHELMHLNGIADEGRANIAAWNICREAGGEFSISAQLWILKYAMEMITESAPDVASDLFRHMSPNLFSVFSHMNGKSVPPGGSAAMLLDALGLSLRTSSYPDVVGYILG